MNVVKEIKRLNEREASLSTSLSGSWHEQYKDSAYVFVGGLPYSLTEGDILCVLSQFGEIAGINLVRDKETGQSKGFAFLKYVDQRSTVLAVDNMNGSKVGGRVIRVDHVQNYKVPKVFDDEGNEIEPDEDTINNAAPKAIEEDDSDDESSSASEVDDTGIDIDDPMREYLLKKKRKKEGKSKKSKRKSDKEDGGPKESKAERRARKEAKRAAKKEKKEKGKADKNADKNADTNTDKDMSIDVEPDKEKAKENEKSKDIPESKEADDKDKDRGLQYHHDLVPTVVVHDPYHDPDLQVHIAHQLHTAVGVTGVGIEA
ncbi:MAG: RNA-binding motif protein [Benniella sp.]|nr:MAG: RNA-binding motif protein [Benniella sp.]